MTLAVGNSVGRGSIRSVFTSVYGQDWMHAYSQLLNAISGLLVLAAFFALVFFWNSDEIEKTRPKLLVALHAVFRGGVVSLAVFFGSTLIDYFSANTRTSMEPVLIVGLVFGVFGASASKR